MRRIAALLLVFLAWPAAAALPVEQARVIRTYPHDTTAFTEGLLIRDGWLYESTGFEGRSFIRKKVLTTGRTVQSIAIPPNLFGEGIVDWGNTLYSFVWHGGKGFKWTLPGLKAAGNWTYSGEGWAMTQDGRHIIMSDGTPVLRFLDPKTMRVVRRLRVTVEGAPIASLNELEYVRGEILANIWQTAMIARIDPHTGKVKGWIDLTALWQRAGTANSSDAVPNGIAYDKATGNLFVTGKDWPFLYQISLPGGH
ncbi:MAG TPA: glutaminyl-peptide cyclotransferase [Sphingomonas sp.]|uniref:glutaminyl-peptide cyclotransferase n=1 Tax=Sphingomonas sp. TaxID=28214 RepID=UPI002C388EB5|nr:glutaminyl-peptide cyclotransferase [Sphingomonas sp.]HMI19607.1 glutaminyl-peptide cyclotransferase [Sphingomonas sp.]